MWGISSPTASVIPELDPGARHRHGIVVRVMETTAHQSMLNSNPPPFRVHTKG
jgi:hypothetical protein